MRSIPTFTATYRPVCCAGRCDNEVTIEAPNGSFCDDHEDLAGFNDRERVLLDQLNAMTRSEFDRWNNNRARTMRGVNLLSVILACRWC